MIMGEAQAVIEAKRWHLEQLMTETIEAINQNNMEAVYAQDKGSAVDEIIKRIPEGAAVTHGGSYTLHEVGIIDILRKGKFRYLRQDIGTSDGVLHEVQMTGFSSDVYLTSVNAITRKGELVALDGTGNRVACLFFGPQKVIVVAGKNKIVDNVESALRRIKEYVAPVHARRRGWNLPCAKTGKCEECRSERRICNKLAVLSYERVKSRITVILVGEDLGI
jgi:L-lactate utilization protein LutB